MPFWKRARKPELTYSADLIPAVREFAPELGMAAYVLGVAKLKTRTRDYITLMNNTIDVIGYLLGEAGLITEQAPELPDIRADFNARIAELNIETVGQFDRSQLARAFFEELTVAALFLGYLRSLGVSPDLDHQLEHGAGVLITVASFDTAGAASIDGARAQEQVMGRLSAAVPNFKPVPPRSSA